MKIIQCSSDLAHADIGTRQVFQFFRAIAQETARLTGLQLALVYQQFTRFKADRKTAIQRAAPTQSFCRVDLEQTGQFHPLQLYNQALPGVGERQGSGH